MNTADEEVRAVPIMNIELLNNGEEEEILRNIDEKIASMDCQDEEILERLREILIKNRRVFRECPGRIEGYEHEFQVTDRTPYFQRVWPVPLAYKEKVKDEIDRMLRYLSLIHI